MINNKKNILILIVVLVIVSSFILYYRSEDQIEEIPYPLFLKHLERGLIEEVTLTNSSKISILLVNGTKVLSDNPRTLDFKEELLLSDVKVIEKEVNSKDTTMLIFFMLGLVALIFFIRKNFSKNAEKEIENILEMDTFEGDLNISFNDIAGNEEAKETLREMVDFINNPEVYKEFGARLPRGVMLYGPPGTGKTLLAKALAGEAGVPIYPVSGSDFVQIYAGVGAARIRDLFKKAKKSGKSVIFIDEIDSLGKKRKTSNISGSEEGDRTLNALLAEMSGFKENEGIIVVAATNRIDVLDEALLRPGRFDRQVEVQLPDVNARYKILELHGKNKPLSKDVDLKKLASETIYFSGAQLENLLNESAMLAVRSRETKINKEHINRAYYKVLVGDEKKDRSIYSNKDKEVTAFHESGHALVAKKVSSEHRVTRVSIIPSTKGIGGFSLNIPPDKMYQTKQDMVNNIMIALGGRAAEEIVYGKDNITTGASSDLEKATEIALAMIGIYGMDNDTGLLSYNVLHSKDIGRDNSLIVPVRELLGRLYSDTIILLNDSKNELHGLANALLDKEVLDESEIEKIINL